MKYYSEVMNQAFDTEKECLKAEKDFVAKKEAEEAKKKAAADERKARAKEVEEALNEVKAAKEKYNKLLHDFCEQYGSFHYSISSPEADKIPSLFDFFGWF